MEPAVEEMELEVEAGILIVESIRDSLDDDGYQVTTREFAVVGWKDAPRAGVVSLGAMTPLAQLELRTIAAVEGLLLCRGCR
jgi:hypothetical protein